MATIEEGKEILGVLGLPAAQQNEISSLTLLVLAGMFPKNKWKNAEPRTLRVHDVIIAMKNEWKRKYAENTRETIRRQVLHQLEQARVVDRNPDEPGLPTNSPRTHYRLTEECAECIRFYGTAKFSGAIRKFRTKFGSLQEKYRKLAGAGSVAVILPEGQEISLSPGKHNALQKLFIEQFIPRFAKGAEVIYIGDAAKKFDKSVWKEVQKLDLKLTDHGKLPDIILQDKKRKWLFLVEAVTSHGPVSPKREMELRALFQNRKFGLIFVTAFAEKKEFRRHASNIAWETEVWIAEEPGHLIHFNGNKFMGPMA